MTDQPQSLIEREIATLEAQTRTGENRGKKLARLRKIIAYGLKAIAGGGSLVVATGYLTNWQQVIGVAILVAIFLDTISSNHKRLLAEATAGYTYEFLRESHSRKYNRELDPLLKQLKKSDLTQAEAEAAHKAIDTLQRETQKELAEGIAQIKKNLADSDLKALEALTLDKERAAAQ